MSEPASKPPTKVTLEDLLRLKRHERPGPEFWARFDQELRSRALREFVAPAPSPWKWAWAFAGRLAPWMAGGAVAAVVLGMTMHERITQTVNATPRQAVVVASAAPVVMPTPVTEEKVSADNISPTQAPAFAAPSERTVAAYVVAALPDSAAVADFRKPATVSFAAEHSDAVRYAANSLVESAVTTRILAAAN